MLTLPEYLHAVVSKVLEKSIQRKAWPVDVDFAQFAIEIGVFVDELKTQPVCVFQKFADLNRFQIAGLLIMIPPPCA